MKKIRTSTENIEPTRRRLARSGYDFYVKVKTNSTQIVVPSKGVIYTDHTTMPALKNQKGTEVTGMEQLGYLSEVYTYAKKCGVPFYEPELKHIKPKRARFASARFSKGAKAGLFAIPLKANKKTSLTDINRHCQAIASKIRYASFSDEMQHLHSEFVMEDMLEIDVNTAYLFYARQLGIISTELYEKGVNDMPKPTRLMAIGALATQYKLFEFRQSGIKQNGDLVGEYKGTFRKDTAPYFFMVALELDRLMGHVCEAVGKGVLFYWTDAFFCTREAGAKVMEQLELHGVPYKVKDVTRITKTAGKVEVLMAGEMTPKPFSLPSGNKKTKIEAYKAASEAVLAKIF